MEERTAVEAVSENWGWEARTTSAQPCRIQARRTALMADSLLRLLQGLSPGVLYAGVFVLAALENVFPHPPADVGIALAAFLAGGGSVSGWSVFVFAWTGNVSAASGVYFLARRYGRGFFRGPWGRKVLSE